MVLTKYKFKILLKIYSQLTWISRYIYTDVCDKLIFYVMSWKISNREFIPVTSMNWHDGLCLSPRVIIVMNI